MCSMTDMLIKGQTGRMETEHIPMVSKGMELVIQYFS